MDLNNQIQHGTSRVTVPTMLTTRMLHQINVKRNPRSVNLPIISSIRPKTYKQFRHSRTRGLRRIILGGITRDPSEVMRKTPVNGIRVLNRHSLGAQCMLAIPSKLRSHINRTGMNSIFGERLTRRIISPMSLILVRMLIRNQIRFSHTL